MSTIIRQAIFEDIERIEPLWIKLIEFHSEKNYIYESSSDFKEKVSEDIKHLLARPNAAIFIVEQEKKLLGFTNVSISQRPSVFVRILKGYIGETYIDENLRGQGIGTNLISTAMDWLKKQGAEFVDLQVLSVNENGRKFWEKNGFQLVNYYMAKNLT